MLRLRDADQLRETFRAVDQDEIYLPPDLTFPIGVRDYFAWVEPSGARIYLVFIEPYTDLKLGVVFRRARRPADAPAAMCQWCHAVRVGGAVSLLTAAIDRDRRVGLYLCADLNCRENALSPPGVHDLLESIPAEERVKRIRVRMGAFVRRNLFENT
jgi:hypothetical protein